MNPTELLLLVKSPVKGRVKSRLAAGIGPFHAAALYRRFVLDILSTFEDASVEPVICHYPSCAAESIRRWLGPRYKFLGQRGRDHPDRLRYAFEDIFAGGAERAVILASDNPDIPAGFIARAVSALKINDSVIGPTKDGGYYLIGFRRGAFVPGAFCGIDWSSGRVFGQTAEKIKNAGRSLHVLPVWYDIDTIDDLSELARRNRSTPFSRSFTMQYLHRHHGLNRRLSGAAKDG